MSIKILHIIDSLNIGGMENILVQMVNRLQGAKFSNNVCCISTNGPMAERLHSSVSLYNLNKGRGADRLMPIKLAKLIRQVRPDIIHTYNWGGFDGVLGARLAGCKVVVHAEHGRDADDPLGKNKWKNLYRRFFSSWVSQYITVSTDLSSWLKQDIKISSSKICEIVNGVDVENYVLRNDDSSLRESIGLCNDDFLIGFVGRLDPVKDVKTAIKALVDLPNNVKLVVIGSGSEDEKLRNEARVCGVKHRVKFLGMREDISRLLNMLDVFVLPSIAEGTPCTVLEAMASGLPVVASRVGGLPALVDNGKTGFLFNPGDSNTLVKLIQRYVDDRDLCKKHGNAGLSLVRKSYSLGRMTDQYEQLYLFLVGTASRS